MNSGIVDAEFEVLAEPVPDWVRKLVDGMNESNWTEVKKLILSANAQKLQGT
jgi:hypothetical protein